MNILDPKRTLLAALIASGLLLVGCGGGSNNTGVVNSSPAASPASAAITKNNASAVASAVVGGISLPALRATSGGAQAPGLIPTVDLDNPNGSALGLALAVALKGDGSLTSPLGGSARVKDSQTNFVAYQLPSATVVGQLSCDFEQGGPSGNFVARVEFRGLSLTSGRRRLVLDGPARLSLNRQGQVQLLTWESGFTARDESRQRSFQFQDLVSETRLEGDRATVQTRGRLSLQQVNGVTGQVEVSTPRPLEFRRNTQGLLRLDQGRLLLQGDKLLHLDALGSHRDLMVLSLGNLPLREASWNYLGGSNRLLDALRPLQADLIVRNANIITLDDDHPRAQALAVRDGSLLKVGSESDVAALAGPGTEQVDMKGKTVLPGFLEPHMHYDLTSLHLCATTNRNADGVVPANTQFVDCGLYETSNPAVQIKTKQSVLDALAAAVQQNPNASAIFGFNYDPSRLQPSDLFSNLTRAELDSISATIPILVQNASGHISYANSALFAKAKVGGQVVWPNAPNGPYTPPSASGFIASNIVTSGSPALPTGQLNEDAQDPFLEVALPGALGLSLTHPEPQKFLHWKANWRTMQERLAQQGITTAVDMLMGANSQFSLDSQANLTANLESRPDCPTRARIYVNGGAPIDAINVFPGEGNERMRFVGAKFITDGSTQGFTAGLNFNYLVPVAGFIFPAGPTGLLDFVDSMALLQVVKPFYDRGFQLAFHSNGDRSFDLITGMLALLPEDVKNRRTRIEHFTVHQNQELASHIETCKKYGLYPGHTMSHVFYWGQIFSDSILPADIAQNIDPVAPLLAQGIKVSLHSDSPISPSTPLLFVQTAVTRFYQARPGNTPMQLGPQHAVSVLEALKCVTLYPAEAVFSEDEVGSLKPGKLADLVVLDADPTAVNPSSIAQIPILQTRLAGQLVSGQNP